MFETNYYKGLAEYEKNAKKITIIATYPKILNKYPYLSLQESAGNFEVTFDRNGLLLSFTTKITTNIIKDLYFYNKQKKLLFEITQDDKNRLLSISEFRYNSIGRIINAKCRSFYNDSDFEEISENIYSYLENKTLVRITSNYEEEDCKEYKIHNNKQQIIEEKFESISNKLFWWNKYEYDNAGHLIKEISLSESGEQESFKEYLPSKNGFIAGYICDDKDCHYIREYEYTFNDRGHCIHKTFMNDGEPFIYRERLIEYYN